MVPNRLSTLKDLLIKEGLACELTSPSTELPFVHLQASLGEDEKNRSVTALLWLFDPPTNAASAEIKPENAASAEMKPDSDVFLQIFILFPFSFAAKALPATARFLLMLNKVAVFPGFGLSEPEHSLYYKYTLCFPQGRIHARMIADFMGAVQFLYDSHASNIEQVATGARSFEEITSLK